VPATPRHLNLQGRADQRRRLERLRAQLARLDRSERAGTGPILALPFAGIEQALPGGGLARGALHELCGAPEQAAVAGFAAVLLGRLAADGHVAWIGPRDELYGPGLLELGLDPARLIVVRARGRDARLWALEEALRSPGLVAALAEVDRLTLTQSRRLQLAAEAKGVTGFLLRPPAAGQVPSAAFTRWGIEALAGAGDGGSGRRDLGPPCWRVELFRCRGGQPGRWRVAWVAGGWHEVADPVALAAEPVDRPAARARPA
jgi:protein ImuA